MVCALAGTLRPTDTHALRRVRAAHESLPTPSTRVTHTSPSDRGGPRIDGPTFIFHWGLVVVLGVSLSTGLRIASDHAEGLAGIPSRLILWLLPEGRVIELHVTSSWLVTFVALAYGLFLHRSRLARRVALEGVHLRTLDRARRSPRRALDGVAWSAVNRLLFQLAFALIGVIAVTGWMLYNQTYLGASMYWVTTLHGLAAWSIVGYVVLHVVTVVKVGTFWKMLRPRPRHVLPGVLSACGTAVILGATYVAHKSIHPTLRVAMVDAPLELGSDGVREAWDATRPITIHTARGANLPRGEVAVEVRAVHDGESIYFRFRWDDPQRSQKMTPLVKTSGGWRVLQFQLEINDESEYYEDKFAVILSHRPALASGTVHLGQDIIQGSHYRNPRGVHFTEDGGIVDLWHWKSVRSAGVTPGYIDDNHIGPPLPPVAPGTRHTGGYTQDPPSSPHPYVQNWVKVEPEAPLDQTYVRPQYLPRDPRVLERMGEIDLDPTAHDEGIWHLNIEEVVPYDLALDDYPIGAVLPGIVLVGTYEGDRADVLARASWTDGQWTLEAKRLLDTGSKYDVAFARDTDVFLWVSVFNYTQTRHSQHLHPIRVQLE
jgi:hypothetical protein